MLGPTDLDASRHRGLSKSVLPQVRRFPGVPRAVFLGLLRSVLGSRPFRRVHPYEHRDQSTVEGFGVGPATPDPGAGPCRQGPSARGWRAKTLRLGPPNGFWRRISDAPNRPPLPAPRLETLDQTPLGNEAGWR